MVRSCIVYHFDHQNVFSIVSMLCRVWVWVSCTWPRWFWMRPTHWTSLNQCENRGWSISVLNLNGSWQFPLQFFTLNPFPFCCWVWSQDSRCQAGWISTKRRWRFPEHLLCMIGASWTSRLVAAVQRSTLRFFQVLMRHEVYHGSGHSRISKFVLG